MSESWFTWVPVLMYGWQHGAKTTSLSSFFHFFFNFDYVSTQWLDGLRHFTLRPCVLFSLSPVLHAVFLLFSSVTFSQVHNEMLSKPCIRHMLSQALTSRLKEGFHIQKTITKGLKNVRVFRQKKIETCHKTITHILNQHITILDISSG